tara:strand:+ start:375 stop:530 length:156 start_codon:yes stop_codon:yes gene_type:complete
MGAESEDFKMIIQIAGQVCGGENLCPCKKKKKIEIIATGSRMGLFYSQESV